MKCLQSAVLSPSIVLLTILVTCSTLWALGGAHVLDADGRISTWNPDWPNGLGELINSGGCVYGSWVNSNDEFFYRGNIDQFNEFIANYAKLEHTPLRLIIHAAHQRRSQIGGDEPKGDYDWKLTSLRRGWGAPERLNQALEQFVITVDVYVGANVIEEDRIVVPDGVVIVDKRPELIDKVYAGKGLVRGKIFDITTGEAVIGAKLVLKGQSDKEDTKDLFAVTDKLGIYLLADVPPGVYAITVHAPGYASRMLRSYDNRVPELYEFSLGLAPEKSICGVVVDREGRPLNGVTVTLGVAFDTNGNEYPVPKIVKSITGSNGRFALDGLPTGQAKLSCRVTSWHEPGPILNIYPCPSDDLRLVMERTGAIRGHVANQTGQSPTTSMIVELRTSGEQLGKWRYSGQLADDGSFEISGIPPGEYVITTFPTRRKAGDQADETKVTVKGGEISHIRLQGSYRD